MLVIEQCKVDRTRHMRALLLRIPGFSFFMKTYNLCLVTFSNFDMVFINYYEQDFVSSNFVCNHTSYTQNCRTAKRECDLFITSWTGLDSTWPYYHY